MEALTISFTGKDLVELRMTEIEELTPNHVLVQATKTLISTGTEGIVLSRLFEPGTHWDGWVHYPFDAGYSMIGRIIKVADDVTNFKVGDRVALRQNHKQYAVANAGNLIRVPDNVPDEDASWFALAKIAQNGVRRAQHKLGDAVAIVGLGPLGQLVTQYVRLMGAREIIAIDPAEKRLELAKAHGATAILPMSVQDAKEQVMQLTDGRGPDVIYDVTGHPAVFQCALGLLPQFGKLLLLGDTGKPSEQRLTYDVVVKGLSIIGAHDGNPPGESSPYEFWSTNKIIELFFTYLKRGDMFTADLITHRFSPEDAVEAYRLLREDRSSAMGVVFDWTRI
jgi:2-desacetyl-2-hydroxyethyl bacteriochlorophyllide A dehydrogenase